MFRIKGEHMQFNLLAVTIGDKILFYFLCVGIHIIMIHHYNQHETIMKLLYLDKGVENYATKPIIVIVRKIVRFNLAFKVLKF